MEKIEPLDDRILVECLEPEDKTPGGLILPDIAKDKPQKGRVLAVGPGKMVKEGWRTPVDVKVGDTVLFGRYAGNPVNLKDRDGNIICEASGVPKDFYIMKEHDLLATAIEDDTHPAADTKPGKKFLAAGKHK